MTNTKTKGNKTKAKASDKQRATNDVLIAKVVKAALANNRKAAAKTKKRNEVSGGGAKPWRQKGTGRARAGSNRSPIWRGGGVTFGPTGEQNYKLKVNKKEKKIALNVAYELKKSDMLEIIIPKMTKTKEAAAFLAKNNASRKILILASKETFNDVKKVFNNIPELKIMIKGNESVYDILWAKKIIRDKGQRISDKADKKVDNKRKSQ